MIDLANAIPMQDIDAERTILGAMLFDPDAALMAAEHLTADDFHREQHRILYEHMQRMEVVEEVALRSSLANSGQLEQVGGREYIRELVQDCRTSAFLSEHIKAMREASRKRAAATVCKDALQSLYSGASSEDVINQIESQLLSSSVQGNGGVVHVSSILRDVIAELQSDDKPSRVVSTGFYGLDQLTGGMEPGDLITLAARPSVGKTSFALNLIRNAADLANVGTLFFSLEMTKEQVSRNLLCLHGKFDSEHMKARTLAAGDKARLSKVGDQVSRMPISIVDSGDVALGRMRATVRRACRQGVGLVVVDYAQLMRGDNLKDDQRMQMVSVTRGLKALAKACSIPVVLLCQLSRDAEEQEPKLKHLKESGSFEEDSDKVLMLHRKTRRDRNAIIDVAKNRNGQTGKVEFEFAGEHFEFKAGIGI